MSPQRIEGPREESRGYQRWPDDWLDSRTIRDMTFEEEGVYARLLDASWKYVGLPVERADVESLIEKTIPDRCAWILDALFPVASTSPHAVMNADFSLLGEQRRFCDSGRIEVQRIQSRCGRVGRAKQDPGGVPGGSTRRAPPEKEKEKEKEVEKEGEIRTEAPPWHPEELPNELEDPIFYRAADAWVEHRREYKRPKWKPVTWRSNLRKLAPLGAQGAADCLQLSMDKVWAGIFPERMNGRARPKTPVDIEWDRIQQEKIDNGLA